MRFIFVCVTFLLIYTSLVKGSLYKRDLQQRRYYTLHIPNGNEEVAKQISKQLNARYEGRIGELKQYHEISIIKKKSTLNKRGGYVNHNGDRNTVVDPLTIKFNQLKDKRKKFMKRNNNMMMDPNMIDQVNSLTPQIRHRRIVKRAPPLPPPSFLEKRQNDDDDGSVSVNSNSNQVTIISSKDYLKLPNGFELLRQNLDLYDPGFEYQWHLVNQDTPGNDVNATGVWSQGITGKNVVVAILDDGLDMENEDLKDNFFAEGSYDFNDHTSLPKPKLEDDTHGTRCAGEIAAVKNGLCGVGVAHGSKVAGVRILSAEITDEDEARALNYKYQENHIYSCSWGPPDYGEVAEAPQGIVLDAIKNGIANGRNGSGSIFVFASGNGGGNDDNCNFDGYTNSIYTITVGAIDHLENHPFYSEKCSAQLVVTYSSGSGGNIYTTDIGQNQCTDRHGGTSAAAPLASGIFALVLSVRPDLSWRDMQHLCVETAIPISLDDEDWDKLPSGRMYNHKFGYGKLDAFAIVERAKTFESVRAQTYLQVSSPRHVRDIPDRSSSSNHKLDKLVDTITITQDMIDGAGISKLEHVTVTVYIEHGRRGDLEILLESPQNIISQLGTPRKFDVSSEGLIDWTFMTVKHWEEEPAGDWKLHIIDWKNSQFTGKFTNWTITLWGEMVEEPEDGELIHVPIIKPASPTKINTNINVSKVNQVPQTVTTAIAQPTKTSSVLEQQLTDLEPISSTPTSIINNESDNNDDNGSDDQQENNSINILPDTSMQLDDLQMDDKNESKSSSNIIVIFMVLVSMGIFSWLLRRRIKGPRPAKDMTAYSTIGQHHYDPNPFEFESLDHHHRPPHHHLSDTNSDISDHHSRSSHSFDGTKIHDHDDDFNINRLESSFK
ncbi:unnamed protein product [Cunninghamella blakesleeana]